ncbi:hypothetical protein ALC57_05040 [Trachymyrmex cornetzi]|uniref:Uncharacterized protein n=1 Tax=Trachymyrmex cornetzi TaxID=471704 RepID=A0A151JC32_9HYME|nr:hypothetical protein ALC57_05040 [Trachymyrmex cornetzi]
MREIYKAQKEIYNKSKYVATQCIYGCDGEAIDECQSSNYNLRYIMQANAYLYETFLNFRNFYFGSLLSVY